MAHTHYNLVLENEALDLGELKDYTYQLSQLLLGLICYLICELKTVKGDVYQIPIQKQVLGMLMGENHNESLDKRLSEYLLYHYAV